MKSFVTALLLITLITGCGSLKKPEVPKKREDILLKMDRGINLDFSKDELYFKATHKKKFYQKTGKIIDKKVKWSKVTINTKRKYKKYFIIMTSAVERTNISFEDANRYCIDELHATLVNPFVFDKARATKSINKPNNARYEILTAYDEEEEDIYLQEGDKLESKSDTIVIFDWKDEKYYAVSNLLKDNDITFRCMKIE